MTDFTFGGKFGCFGRKSYARAWSWWSSHSKAVLPKPVAASRSIWRRVIGLIFFTSGSVFATHRHQNFVLANGTAPLLSRLRNCTEIRSRRTAPGRKHSNCPSLRSLRGLPSTPPAGEVANTPAHTPAVPDRQIRRPLPSRV